MSKKNKKPITSIEAYKALTPEMLNSHHSKIIKALIKLKSAICEEIAQSVGMGKDQISKRLSELEALQLIYKPGTKKKTSAGRNAFVYELIENPNK